MARASLRVERVIPKGLHFEPEFVDALIEQELDAAQAGVKKDFERTVRTWKNKPDFKTEKQPGKRWVKTNNLLYFWLNEGTKRHPISGKNGGRLAYFKTGFVAKSRPDALVSRSGKAANKDFRRPFEVVHPGTKPRNWSRVIQKKWQGKLSLNLRKAMKKATQ
jgi:hypothetical protein